MKLRVCEREEARAGVAPAGYRPRDRVTRPTHRARRADDLSAPARWGRLVHELRLQRRRSRVPWVYVVYHRREMTPVDHRQWVRGAKGAGLFQE